jgi:hypothetical protein
MLSETLDPPNQKRGDFKQYVNFSINQLAADVRATGP